MATDSFQNIFKDLANKVASVVSNKKAENTAQENRAAEFRKKQEQQNKLANPSASDFDLNQDEEENQSVIVNQDEKTPFEELIESQQEQQQADLGPAEKWANEYQGSDTQEKIVRDAFNREREQHKTNVENLAKSYVDNSNSFAELGTIAPVGVEQDDEATSAAAADLASRPWFDELYDRTHHSDDSVDPDTTLLSFADQDYTPKAARNLYDFYFNKEDANGVRNENGLTTKLTGGVVDPSTIDDGADPSSREAYLMTGDQYIKYRTEFGLPGRDVDKIDPNALYSKQDEQEQYGFIPYITTEDGMNEFHNNAGFDAVNNLFNSVGNARKNLTDYTINYGDKSFSGKDFDSAYEFWSNTHKGDKPAVITRDTDDKHHTIDNQDPEGVTEDSSPMKLVLTMDDGQDIDITSGFQIDYEPDEYDPSKGVYVLKQDGASPENWIEFDSIDELQDKSHLEYAQDGDYVYAWANRDPLILSDGTKLRADQADEIYNNEDSYAQYNAINRPYAEDPWGGDKWLPYLIDNALVSSPLFFMPVAGAQAAANAYNASRGLRAGSQNDRGEYQLISEDPTQAERNGMVIADLAMPATEKLFGLAGSTGKTLFNPTKAITKKLPKDVAESPIYKYLDDVIQEGLEEIPGQWVEELQNVGDPAGWFKNPMYRDANDNLVENEYNEDGSRNRVAYDDTGKVIKNTNMKDLGSEVTERGWNFLQSIPSSFVGGASLGGVLGLPTVATPSHWRTYNNRKKEREETGYNQEESPEARINMQKLFEDAEQFYSEG